MIDTLIIGNEAQDLAFLQEKITTYCPILTLVGEARDAETAYNLILEYKPKLLFLDIEHSHKDSAKSFFEVIEKIPEYKYELIFVAASKEYAVQAIKYQALDYLLKPINKNELEKAISIASDRLMINDELTDFMNDIQYSQSPNNRLWIPMSDGLQAIEIHNINRFEAAGRYTYIYLNDSTKILSTRNLKEYITLLSKHTNFLHVHRSHFINANYIVKYVSTDGGYILMNNQSQVPIARRKKQRFLSKIIML